MEHPHQAVGGGDLVDAVVVGQHRRQVDEPGPDADRVGDKQRQDGGVAGHERQEQDRDAAQQLTEVTAGQVRSAAGPRRHPAADRSQQVRSGQQRDRDATQQLAEVTAGQVRSAVGEMRGHSAVQANRTMPVNK